MRQDISTYQCYVEEEFKVAEKCDKIQQTVDLRQKRLKRLSENTAPAIENFLDGIIDGIRKLN